MGTPAYEIPSKHPDVLKYDLSSLRALLSGAAPLTAELIKQLSERFPQMSIGQSYGTPRLSIFSDLSA